MKFKKNKKKKNKIKFKKIYKKSFVDAVENNFFLDYDEPIITIQLKDRKND